MHATLLLLLTLGSAAGEAASSPALTEQRALALELVALVQPEASYKASIVQITDQMLPGLEAQLKATGKSLPANFRQRFLDVMNEVAPYDESVEWASELYAQRFTVSELKELIAFYKTPVGRKVAAKLPEIMGEIGKRVSAIIPQRLPGAMKRHGLLPDSRPQPTPAKATQPAQ